MNNTLNIFKNIINDFFIVKNNDGKIIYPENKDELNIIKKKYYLTIFHNKTDDVIFYKQKEKELSIDALTNVYLRGKTLTKINDYLKLAIIRQEEFCLTIVDVDNFKNINDTYGHDIGDRVLKEVANTLFLVSRSSRENDIIGRFGGDEFILLFKNIKFYDMVQRLTQLKEQINHDTSTIDNNLTVTCSFGSYFVYKSELQAANNPELLWQSTFKNADNALYLSKNQGKNKIHILKKDMKC